MTILEQPVLLGSQTPTIHVVPEFTTSAGPEVCALADRAGLVLDPWQRLVLWDALGERPDGKWAAFESGLLVGRQNGKSAVFEARMLAGLFLFNEKLLIYSAHEFKTAGEIFRRMDELIAGTPAFSRRVKSISKTRGEEGFELTTRQRLRFLARSTGSGRGFSGDLNIWDESQHLGDGPVDALMPTMSARQNPQLWYGGSAPDYTRAPCEQIARVRRRAMSGKSKGLAYFEWSAELCTDQCGSDCAEHDDPADPLTWAKTNPGLGIRIDAERIEREYDSMSSGGFARERLSVGRYPSEGAGWEVISQEAWEATEDVDSKRVGAVAFAVDVTPDRSAASIAVAGLRADGLLHVELVEYRAGTGWVVGRLGELIEKWSPCAIALDESGPAGSLVADCDEAGIELTKPKSREAAAACGQLYDAIVRPPEADPDWASRLRHIPHPKLTAALAGADKRPLGDAWAWARRGVSVDISPLVAVTLAGWAFATRPRDEEETEPWVAWT
jgi:hypothetical protein